MEEKTERRIAVLIDAENISGKYIKLIFDEISNYGVVTYRRLYGDFQIASVKAWMKYLSEYAITPVFQYNYTHGKNASDSALIIDAMDILYSGHVDGFCIVTSDSDFTKLVSRLRESGMTVIGMGEQKTPAALVSACENFKFLDVLYAQENRKKNTPPKKRRNSQGAGAAPAVSVQAEENRTEMAAAQPEENSSGPAAVPQSAESISAGGRKRTGRKIPETTPELPALLPECPLAAADAETDAAYGDIADTSEAQEEEKTNIPDLEEMEKEIFSIIDTQAGDDGWVDLSELGDNLPKRVPGFDPRNYGCSKLRQFIEKFDSLEVRQVQNPHNSILNVIYVRIADQENGTAAETQAQTAAPAEKAPAGKSAAGRQKAKKGGRKRTANGRKKAGSRSNS